MIYRETRQFVWLCDYAISWTEVSLVYSYTSDVGIDFPASLVHTHTYNYSHSNCGAQPFHHPCPTSSYLSKSKQLVRSLFSTRRYPDTSANMKVSGKIYIISGGVSGLGLATAKALHEQGAYVSLLDLNADNGSKIVSELGSRSKFFETDVSDTDAITAAVQGSVAWAKETGKEIGGVIAGAGVGLPGLIIDKKNEPLSIQSIDFVLNINLRGTLDLIRQVVPYMTKATPSGADGERGVIIMIASSAAFDGQMGQVAYAASKGAVASLTLPLARDLSKYGIRAVTIAPSMFDSAMTRMMSNKVKQSLENSMEFPKRAGLPEEFARLVLECVGNEMLNGTVIRLDGAMRMPARL